MSTTLRSGGCWGIIVVHPKASFALKQNPLRNRQL